MCWALNGTLLSLFGFLLWNYGTRVVFFWNKTFLGYLEGFVTGRWQYSLTHFGTLWLRQSASVCFLPVVKTLEVVHLLKLFWDPFPLMKSHKLIRHFEMTAIWFGFHNRDCKICLRSGSSQCYILHMRLPAIWDFHFVCAVLNVLLCLNRWKSWSRGEFGSTMQEPLLITATHCCYSALSEDQGSVFIMSLVYILWYFQSVSAELRLTEEIKPSKMFSADLCGLELRGVELEFRIFENILFMKTESLLSANPNAVYI